MRRGCWVAIGTVVIAACTSGSSSQPSSAAKPAPRVTSSVTKSGSANRGSFDVRSLGIRFRLPPSFARVDNPDFGFLARSENPRAIFSIDLDEPSVVDHSAEPGEFVADVTVGGHPAVLVTNAVVEGLPPGIEARELLVANGNRSFSAILSAESAELPALWDAFFTSAAFATL